VFEVHPSILFSPGDKGKIGIERVNFILEWLKTRQDLKEWGGGGPVGEIT